MADVRKRTEDEQPEQPGAGDYFVVEQRYESWCVSTSQAKHIEAEIDRGASWVVFVTIFGSRVRCRTDSILSIVESRADQRAAMRAADRAEGRRVRAEQPWDENDREP